MKELSFPMIDMAATGKNILQLRKSNGLTVRDMQRWFNFAEPRAIYKWQQGECLPSVDNLYGLSVLFDVPIDQILVGSARERDDIEPFMNGSFFMRKIGDGFLRGVLFFRMFRNRSGAKRLF